MTLWHTTQHPTDGPTRTAFRSTTEQQAHIHLALEKIIITRHIGSPDKDTTATVTFMTRKAAGRQH
eukprot:2193644-Rhodomonas_salina.1